MTQSEVNRSARDSFSGLTSGVNKVRSKLKSNRDRDSERRGVEIAVSTSSQLWRVLGNSMKRFVGLKNSDQAHFEAEANRMRMDDIEYRYGEASVRLITDALGRLQSHDALTYEQSLEVLILLGRIQDQAKDIDNHNAQSLMVAASKADSCFELVGQRGLALREKLCQHLQRAAMENPRLSVTVDYSNNLLIKDEAGNLIDAQEETARGLSPKAILNLDKELLADYLSRGWFSLENLNRIISDHNLSVDIHGGQEKRRIIMRAINKGYQEVPVGIEIADEERV